MKNIDTGVAYAILLVSTAVSVAGAAGVPSLGAAAAGYEAYSSDDALPDHFKTLQLDALDNTPLDNPITDAGAELGRVLFYDPRLSHNNTTACANCHTQATGFADADQFSTGFEGGLTGRHSMGLSNARWGTERFFWDERAASLEAQVLAPIQDAVEMGTDLGQLREELAATDFYQTLFARAYGSDALSEANFETNLSRSLAQFVRSMASYQAPYDAAVEAGSSASPDFAAAGVENPALAARGHTLFQQNCANCHRTDAQVGASTHNIGLPDIDTDGDGVIDVDLGAGDRRFRVPSLRNIALRGRYTHDGRFSSLAEVIAFYASGSVNNGSPLGRGIQPGGLGLSADDQAALIAFLQTLTDTEFLTSQLFSNPLVALAGDYDGSGVVNGDDWLAWRDQFGQTEADVEGPLTADGNGDGRVDTADYALWRDNLGARWDDNVAAAVRAVPEPAAWALVTLAIAGLPRRGRVTRAVKT